MSPEHSEHCRACKERVRELQTAIYGDCQVGYSFPWPSKPEAYKNSPIGDLLCQICRALEEFRGYRDFIKSPQVPPCDFYVSDPAFILEFDESQHFTHARLVALSLYPPQAKVGFPVARWQELCRLIDARDDDPPDRDERRAWYDTLRDLVPALHGLKPTVRVYANEFHWCSLNSGSAEDREKLRSILKERLPF